MNAEKFVKQEAKSSLSGNWVVGILSVMVLCFIPIIVMLVIDIAYSLAGDVDGSVAEAISSSPQGAVFFVVFHLLAVVTVLLLSPLMNGFARVFSSVADKKTAELSDLFYFFETKERYVKSVKFMTKLIVRAVIVFVVSEIPAAALFLVSGEDEFMLGMVVILAVLGALCTFAFLHRYTFAMMLFSYHEYGGTESLYMGAQISKKYCKSLIKLTVTFIPWLLLTFFVVPFIYVYPYMTCSYFVAAKYLYQQYAQNLENTVVSNGMIPTPAANSSGAEENPIDNLLKYVTDTVVSQSENSENADMSKSPVSLEKNSGETDSDAQASEVTANTAVPTENEEKAESGFTTENSVNAVSDEGGKVLKDL